MPHRWCRGETIAAVRGRGLQIVVVTVAVLASAGLAWAAGGVSNIVGPRTRIQPTGRQLNPVGKLTKLGNFPTGGARTPDGRFLWTLSTGRGPNDIRIVRVRPRGPIGKIVQTIRMPGLSGGIAMSPDGRSAYVSGLPDSPHTDQQVPANIPGQQGDVIAAFKLNRNSGKAQRNGVIPVPPPSGAPAVQTFPPDTATASWPRDLAVSPDGKTLLAALNLADSAAIIDTKTQAGSLCHGRPLPLRGRDHPRRARIGLVTSETQGTVSVIDLASGQVVKRRSRSAPHLSHPEGIAIDPKRDARLRRDHQRGPDRGDRHQDPAASSGRSRSPARRGNGTTPTQVSA